MKLTKKVALELLTSLKAPEHLITHVTLVGEAAELLIEKCSELGLELDDEFIRVGVVIHDIGKIVHPHEMTGPGSEHEPEGMKILLSLDVPEKVARCCLSHARWNDMACSLEELLIALSDKLWKGKRVAALELEVIERISTSLGLNKWEVFQELDSHFESIAADGYRRLQLSVANNP